MFKELAVKTTYLPKVLFVISFCLLLSVDVSADEVLVDPTRPIQQSRGTAEKPQYILNAIFIASDRRHVVINGQQISEGGKSGSLKVLKIRSNDVVVSISGENKILRLHSMMRKNVNEIVKDKGAVIDTNKKSEMVVR